MDELSRTLARVVSTDPILGATDAIDEARVIARPGRGQSLAAELIEVFLEETPTRLAELRRGVDAGDADLVREPPCVQDRSGSSARWRRSSGDRARSRRRPR